MDESINYAEYTVEKKPEGKNLQKRLLMYGVYLVALIAVVVLIAVIPGAALWGGIIGVLLIAMIFFGQRMLKEERKYEVTHAKLKIQEINGNGKSKVVVETLISEFTVIAPMTEEYKEQWAKADTVLDERGSKKSTDAYFARLEKDGKSTVVYFEATNKMLKVMKFYNSKGTVVTTVRI